MEKLLFTNVDASGTDKESWCRYEPTLGKGKIDASAKSKGTQFDCYRAFRIDDGNNYSFAYNKGLNALVLTERGTMRASGFVMVVSGSELFEERYAAGYIGSKKPDWMPSGGTIFESEMESNLNDTSWLKYDVPKTANTKYIREKIVPFIFLLLKLKRDNNSKKLVCICESNSEITEMEGLLKSSLMALPIRLSNQYSFISNATAEQLEISDVSCITQKAFERCTDLNKDNFIIVKYPFPIIDAEQLSKSSFCQYIFDDGIIPKDINPEICSVEELERVASDIRLENYCKNRIPCEEVAKAFELYDAAHADYIASSPNIFAAFTQLAYEVYLSKFYSQTDKATLMRLQQFIDKQESGHKDTTYVLNSNELLSELMQEQDNLAVEHLSRLLEFAVNESGISVAQKKHIIDLLCGKVNNISGLLPLFERLVEGLGQQRFIDFLRLVGTPENEEWKNIIVNKVICSDKDFYGLSTYFAVREDNTKLWLFEAIISQRELQSIEDISTWLSLKEKCGKKAYEVEQSLLKDKFLHELESFLEKIEFYKPAEQVLKSIGDDQLEQIFSAAEKFEYSNKSFNTQRDRIIQLTKKETAIITLKNRALIPLRGKRQVKASDKLIQKATLNHFATNTPALLFLFLILQMAAIIFAFFFTADFAIWEILGALSGTLSAASIRILFIGIPLLICLAIYISVIMHGRQYETQIVAIRSFSISTLSVLLPIAVFLLTTGIIFH